jgi:hypothetical protein
MYFRIEVDGHVYHYPNVPDHMIWPFITSLEECGFDMDNERHLARARERIANLENERDELRREVETMATLLGSAQESICALLCPTVWKTGTTRPHTHLCQEITALLGTPNEDS